MANKSIRKNTIFNALKTMSSIIFPLITFPYISRVLLPENVGRINFGLSVVSYFDLVASLGITTYAIRECSSVKDSRDKLSDTASQIWSINIITTILSYILLAVVLVSYRKLDNYRTLILIQSLSILFTTISADWLNQAMEDYRYITIRTVFFQFISLTLMFIFVHHPEDYIKYAIINLVASSGASITNIWYRRRFCIVRFKVNIDWKRHAMPIIYLFVMILAQTIFNTVDSTMLGLIHGDYAVGIYSTAHKMSFIITQLITSLLWVIMPRMSYYYNKEDYSGINSLLRKVLGFNVLVGLPLAVGVFFLSDEIVRIVAGSQYAEAGGVLKILMIAFVFTIFGGGFIGNAILLPSKREKAFMTICCIAAVINVIANYIYIPRYGAKAAAGTTAFCSFLIFILLLFCIDKRIKIERCLQLIIAPLFGCAGIVTVCILCKHITALWGRTIISVVGSVISYFVIVYFGGNELLKETIESLRNRYFRR